MRVALLDDSGLFRAALRALLEAAGLEVVGDVGTGPELVGLVRRTQPDVALVDICLSSRVHDEQGLQVAEHVDAIDPSVGLLVLSTYDDTSYATRLLQLRGTGIGYLLKDRVDTLPELLDALERVRDGQTAIDVDIVARLIRHQRGSGALDTLTAREQDVLRLIAEGRSNLGIGEALCLSPRTVEAHVAAAFAKLDLPQDERDNRRVHAALSWLRAGGAARVPSDGSRRRR